MTGEPDLVTLLYRADWTRLSLTADVRGMLDYQLLARYDDAQHRRLVRSAPPGLTGVRHFRARLLVVPGGRYCAPADGDGDEFFTPLNREAVPEGLIPGLDEPADTGPRVQTGLTLRYTEMLRPVSLLSGFALALRGPVTFADRDAYHVVATPAPRAAAAALGRKPLDRIEVFVDAATGILLRREEVFAGQTLRFTEFASARFGPLAAADAERFAPVRSIRRLRRRSRGGDPGGRPFPRRMGGRRHAFRADQRRAAARPGPQRPRAVRRGVPPLGRHGRAGG